MTANVSIDHEYHTPLASTVHVGEAQNQSPEIP